MSEALLEVAGLHKHYPIASGLLRRLSASVHAVNGVSFRVERGESFGIVGESGCGKSTLGRIILRLEEPTKGSVFFEGRDMGALSRRQMRELRRNMQIVFQDPYSSLNPSYRVGTLLTRPLAVHRRLTPKERRSRVVEVLEKCGLDATAMARFASEFSGGQRQRIGIARALVLNPSLIVLDEPVSALDVSVQAQVLNLLKDLQEELHLTYIFIAHNLSVERYIADRVLVMYLGSMMELAPSAELFAEPLHPYTQALISAVPIASTAARAERIVLKGGPPGGTEELAGCPFHPRCPRAMEICSSVRPQWRELRKEHYVACHLY